MITENSHVAEFANDPDWIGVIIMEGLIQKILCDIDKFNRDMEEMNLPRRYWLPAPPVSTQRNPPLRPKFNHWLSQLWIHACIHTYRRHENFFSDFSGFGEHEKIKNCISEIFHRNNKKFKIILSYLIPFFQKEIIFRILFTYHHRKYSETVAITDPIIFSCRIYVTGRKLIIKKKSWHRSWLWAYE